MTGLRKLIPLVAFLLLVALVLPSSLANVVIANGVPEVWVAPPPLGSDSNPGTEAAPFATIQKGINTIEDLTGEGTVHVAAGTYHENLLIHDAVNLTGAGAQNTIIDGSDSGLVMVISSNPDTENTISGFTIQNGRYAVSLWNPTDQRILYAGLKLPSFKTLTQPSTILYGGGGILIGDTHIVTLNDCVIKDNITQRGGGITNTGQLSMYRCTVSGNTAADDVGGGIFNTPGGPGDSGMMWLYDCTISGNSAAEFGGGIRNEGQMWLTNCTISGNHMTHDEAGGGGIWNNGDMTLVNCTIAYNSAGSTSSSAGGGFMTIDSGTVSFKNTLVANNTAGNSSYNNGYIEYPPVTSQGYNLSSDNSCGFYQPTDLVNTNPLLGPLQDNGGPTFTHAIMHGSPAIDNGGDPGDFDQRGVPRPQGPAFDIGAYELTQASVDTSTNEGTASFSTLNGYITDLSALNEGQTDCGQNPNLYFPFGLFSFNVTDITPGSTVTVVIILPSNAPTDIQYWKCLNGQWVDCTSLLGSNDGDQILTLSITDGGLGDGDEEVNGQVSDPGGPVAAASVSTSTLSGSPLVVEQTHPDVSPSLPRLLNPPQMSVLYLSVSPKQATASQPVTISTNVVNTGDQGGNLNIALKINGQVEQTKMVSVGPQASQPVKFTVNKTQPGTYHVAILDQDSSFTVLGKNNAAGTPVNSGLINFLIIAALLIATVAALILSRRPA